MSKPSFSEPSIDEEAAALAPPSAAKSASTSLQRELSLGRATATPWSKLDKVLLLLTLGLLLGWAQYASHGRILWEDEMLGLALLRDPSFSHMLSAWRHGDDGGGIAFYLTARAWLSIFGATPFAFRLYSQVCFSVALAFCWSSMRRFYGPVVVLISTVTIWFCSRELMDHLIEGRFYGLLLAGFACGLWLCLRAADTRDPAWPLYVATFLTHLLLTATSILGICFSAVLLTTIILLDRGNRVWRPRLYGVIAASWIILLPSLAAIRASSAVGKPHFWTHQPFLSAFLSNYSGFNIHLFLLEVFAVLVLAWRLRIPANRQIVAVALSRRRSAYVFVGVCFALPVVFYAEGFVAAPLCNSRYLFPIILASTFATAELLTLWGDLLPSLSPMRPLTVAAASTLAVCTVVLYNVGYVSRRIPFHKDFRAALAKNLPQTAPVVCEDVFAFTELVGPGGPPSLRCSFLLDWSNSLAPDAPPIEVTQYHLMEKWKQDGYYANSIQYISPFLQQTPEFYTLSFGEMNYQITRPPLEVARLGIVGSNLHARLQADPNFRVTLVKSVPLGDLKAYVWQVCRVGANCAMSDQAAAAVPIPPSSSRKN